MVKELTATQREKQWRAEEDASTMARYQEIINDKNRMSLAMKKANERAKELEKSYSAMKKVANNKIIKKNVAKKSK